MITGETIRMLEETSRRLCGEYSLENVYFARILGKRRHYLAGCGKEVFLPAHQIELTGDIAVFWQGNMGDGKERAFQEELTALLEGMEKQFC